MAVAMAITMLSLLMLAGVGYFLSGLVIHIRTYADEDIYKYETKAGTLVKEDIESLQKEEVFIRSPMLQIAGLFTWLRAGLRFRLVSPIRGMSKVETPILFIHGSEDKYIPMEMTLELYHTKPGHKHLYLAQGADHAQSLQTNPHDYDRIVGAFLEELGLAKAETKPADSEATENGEFAKHGSFI
ncbi:MAG: alpha/beta hydrolase [Paenibacillaceae bacterium]